MSDDDFEPNLNYVMARYADQYGRLVDWPKISDDPAVQEVYERWRRRDCTHEEAWSRAACKVVMRTAFEDGDTMMFAHWVHYPHVSDDFEVQVRYWALRLNKGQSHNMAEMLATRSFPGVKGTDRAFMQGRKLDGSQFETLPPNVGRYYLDLARRAGVNPCGRYYSGTLARFPGDPEAWVDSTHDIRRLCEQRGWGATGAVNIAAPEIVPPEPKPYRVADDIVDGHLRDTLAENPDLVPKAAEVREELAERLSGRG